MKKITAFKIDTGEIFEDENLAIKVECDNKIKQDIQYFCEDIFTHGLTVDQISDILFEHRVDLKEIFKS